MRRRLGTREEFALVLVRSQAEVRKRAGHLDGRLGDEPVLWFAYPKKASKLHTSDLAQMVGWQPLGGLGLEPSARSPSTPTGRRCGSGGRPTSAAWSASRRWPCRRRAGGGWIRPLTDAGAPVLGPAATGTGGGSVAAVTTSIIKVLDGELLIPFTFQEMLNYSGPGSPGGVAMAFKAMELAFPLLDPSGPIERRDVVIHTAFRGPGARDGFELVTRGLTEGRYIVDAGLERPERGTTLEQFVFHFDYRGAGCTLLVREGQVTDEFIALARSKELTPAEQHRFTTMKQDLAERLMASAAADSFDVEHDA